MAGMLPENFTKLHKGEEFIRAKSVEAIERSDEHRLHLIALEASADLIHYFIHRDDHHDEDDLTIRLLGIRVFNCMNVALKLLLSGYYQPAASQIRDLVETLFLLDYLQGDRALIKEWRTADEAVLWKKFKPVTVREALDKRDNFTGKKRGEHYKLLSSIAGHPNPLGFQMVRLPDGKHHCGPFFEMERMIATLSELTKAAIQAASIFGSFFGQSVKSDFEQKINFWEHQNAWFKHFFGKELISRAEIDQFKADVAQLSQ